jgi:fructokinase
MAGDLISGFLKGKSVGTTYLHHENSKSIIALAFLDDNNNASYSFYKGEKNLKTPNFPSPGPGCILFGSFYSISSPTRDTAIN